MASNIIVNNITVLVMSLLLIVGGLYLGLDLAKDIGELGIVLMILATSFGLKMFWDDLEYNKTLRGED